LLRQPFSYGTNKAGWLKRDELPVQKFSYFEIINKHQVFECNVENIIQVWVVNISWGMYYWGLPIGICIAAYIRHDTDKIIKK